MTTPTSEATAPYPTHPLKEVAALVSDYAPGDIYLNRTPTGVLTIHQLLTEDAISEVAARRDAIDIDRRHFLVIRTNEKLDSAVLMAWLSTPNGHRAVQFNVENSRSYSHKLRWSTLGSLQVSVPPLEHQAEQRQMLKLAVDWMDEYVGHFEDLAKTLTKMRHAMADRIVSRPADKAEVYGWLKGMTKAAPLGPADKVEVSITPEPSPGRRPRGP